MTRFLLGWITGIATLIGVTLGVMAWEERAMERAAYDPRYARSYGHTT